MANKPRQPDSNYPLTRAAPARRISRRHPAFAGRPKGIWYPDLVGVVPGYSKTEENFMERKNRSRIQLAALRASGVVVSRAGVPDGWSGARAKALEAGVRASHESKEIVKVMIQQGMVQNPDDPRVEIALAAAVEGIIARDPETGNPLYPFKDRLMAGRLLCDFLKSKPASKIEASVTKAEDFLAVLAAGAAKDS